MNNGSSCKNRKWGLLSLIFAFLSCVVLALYVIVPEGASEEYKYTVLKIFQFGFLPLFLLTVIFLYFRIRHSLVGRMLEANTGWLLPFIAGVILIAIPVFSPSAVELDWRIGLGFSICWVLGTLGVALGLFLLAARLNNVFSGLLCLFASLALAFFAGEFAYLITPQYGDGKWSDAEHSKYVLSGIADAHSPAKETEFGLLPARPDNRAGAAAHRELRYGSESFDAMYTLDEKNRRITPKANPNPEADLLLFGCSFTFGFGMNDDQTWPWLLAKDLGPDWRVVNYAYSGFGAQQTLFMLEEKRIDQPTAPDRQALFLAINDQARRNSGLFAMNSVSYDLLDNGELVRGEMTSKSPYRIIFRWPEILNGSQLARELSHKVLQWFVDRARPEQRKTFVAILEKSSKILREQYGTTLTVLLWPDIEDIAPALEARNIPVLLARNLLADWETKGSGAYEIVPVYETHPNTRAAAELAAGLARYYRDADKTGKQAEAAR